MVGLIESNGYDLTRSKWTDFYQELEDAVSKFGFKLSVLIATDTDEGHAPTEVKNIIMYYQSITKSWWTHTLKSCRMTTMEQIWGATPQQIMQQD